MVHAYGDWWLAAVKTKIQLTVTDRASSCLTVIPGLESSILTTVLPDKLYYAMT